jgi:hypothetical protein
MARLWRTNPETARQLTGLGLDPPPVPPPGPPGQIERAGDDDRITVRLGPVTGEFERGMLAGLTVVTLRQWCDAAGRALAAWPVERVTVSDVRGMVLWVTPPETGPGPWLLSASLTVVEYPVRRRGRLLSWLIGPHQTDPPQPAGATRWTAEMTFPDRAALVVGAGDRSVRLATELRDQAGYRWPGVGQPTDWVGQ